MSSQRTLGNFASTAPDLDNEPTINDPVASEHIVSAEEALTAMDNPSAVSLDDREQRRAVHPCKQHKHPWRSPSWLGAALESETISFVADVHYVDEGVIRHWAHVFGHIDEPQRNQTPALAPGTGGGE